MRIFLFAVWAYSKKLNDLAVKLKISFLADFLKQLIGFSVGNFGNYIALFADQENIAVLTIGERTADKGV